ncbi:hypothetical protein SNOG_13468 [Parastagonospora nodorum SN15]|uniref:Uncharacterized protein n=1 Tax=Phaeosphaeria nodorum (strain SN15 / ATCC MYA-4574 / FGSC 10173) TaxID=321614 RepID=Q0U446_PHANO|nr:hypothetical protein SNOG_13468 [Parastagonospora nodorum SN15]EAT79352.1 hypothetical protein SNOG_13468 [Parastagonospora nodorum SN15]
MPIQENLEVQVCTAVFPSDTQIIPQLFLAYAQSLPITLYLPGKYAVEKGGVIFLAYTTNVTLDEQSSSQGVVALRAL